MSLLCFCPLPELLQTPNTEPVGNHNNKFHIFGHLRRTDSVTYDQSSSALFLSLSLSNFAQCSNVASIFSWETIGIYSLWPPAQVQFNLLLLFFIAVEASRHEQALFFFYFVVTLILQNNWKHSTNTEFTITIDNNVPVHAMNHDGDNELTIRIYDGKETSKKRRRKREKKKIFQ